MDKMHKLLRRIFWKAWKFFLPFGNLKLDCAYDTFQVEYKPVHLLETKYFPFIMTMVHKFLWVAWSPSEYLKFSLV